MSVTGNTWSRAHACFEWDKITKTMWNTSFMMDTSWRNTFLMSTSSQVWKWSVLTFLFYLLQQNRLRPWRRRLTRSEHLKIENRIKQINTFITDNRHLIKKVNTVSKCLHQCRRRRGQSVFKLLLLWTKKKNRQLRIHTTHLKKTKINREMMQKM